MRGFLGILGVVIVMLSVTMMIAGFADLFSGEPDKAIGINIFMLLMFGAITFCGGWMARVNLFHKPDDLSPEQQETLVLKLAQGHAGRLTAAEIAAETALGLVEAKTTLDRLEKHGAAELQITPDGFMVYRFPQLLTAEEKAAALDVLEA